MGTPEHFSGWSGAELADGYPATVTGRAVMQRLLELAGIPAEHHDGNISVHGDEIPIQDYLDYVRTQNIHPGAADMILDYVGGPERKSAAPYQVLQTVVPNMVRHYLGLEPAQHNRRQ